MLLRQDDYTVAEGLIPPEEVQGCDRDGVFFKKVEKQINSTVGDNGDIYWLPPWEGRLTIGA